MKCPKNPSEAKYCNECAYNLKKVVEKLAMYEKNIAISDICQSRMDSGNIQNLMAFACFYDLTNICSGDREKIISV